MKKGSISAVAYHSIGIACGAIFVLAGVVLGVLPASGLYDLPAFCLIIGSFIICTSVISLIKAKKNQVKVDLSTKALSKKLLNNALMIALLAMVVAIAIMNPKFMQFRVFRDILTQSSSRMVIALGMSMVIISGGIDLSASRTIGMAAVVVGSMVQTQTYSHRFFPGLVDLPIFVPILIAIIVCLFIGLLNGFMVSRLNMLPFVATLSVQIIVYGASCLYMNSYPNLSQPLGGFRKEFTDIGQHLLFGKIPILILYAAVALLIIWFILNKTAFGKNIYAIGGNSQAAYVSGVNVKFMLLVVYIISAALYACGGIMEAARTAGATANYGQGYETDAIAAAVVGGVSMSGGVGKISGIIIGVVIFTIISYGLTFIGLDPNIQTIIKGVIIAATVALDVVKFGSGR